MKVNRIVIRENRTDREEVDTTNLLNLEIITPKGTFRVSQNREGYLSISTGEGSLIIHPIVSNALLLETKLP